MEANKFGKIMTHTNCTHRWCFINSKFYTDFWTAYFIKALLTAINISEHQMNVKGLVYVPNGSSSLVYAVC